MIVWLVLSASKSAKSAKFSKLTKNEFFEVSSNGLKSYFVVINNANGQQLGRETGLCGPRPIILIFEPKNISYDGVPVPDLTFS